MFFFFPQKSKMNHRCGQNRIQFPSGQSQELQGDNREKKTTKTKTQQLYLNTPGNQKDFFLDPWQASQCRTSYY